MSAKIDYQKQMETLLSRIAQSAKTPRLLLHACCAPCSSYVIECLAPYCNITIYYYNPNIHPRTEYERRLQELKTFVQVFPPAKQQNICIVEKQYNPADFFDATNVQNERALQNEPEKGERCRRCYEFRMKKAWEYACTNDFDFFTTTLSISPHKDEKKINDIGFALTPLYAKTEYLPANFKKKGGFLRSLALSKEFDLYRQDYCGCIYSQKNSH